MAVGVNENNKNKSTPTAVGVNENNKNKSTPTAF
jgi:hypothetical protein